MSKINLPLAQEFTHTKEALKLKAGHLKLSGDRVFFSIQGEGKNIGLPACFLRLHLCNLTCSWCDTKYTWDKTQQEFWTESEDVPTDKAAQMIREAWGCSDSRLQKRLVITGGEPLIQQKEIQQLVDLLPEWAVEIETNGTIAASAVLKERCQFNCSPKLSNSLVDERKRIHKKVLQQLNEGNTIFKFVVQQTSDIEEIETDFVNVMHLDPNKILVMPEGQSPEVLSSIIKEIIETVKKKGYRVLTRLHCEIWGNKRGT